MNLVELIEMTGYTLRVCRALLERGARLAHNQGLRCEVSVGRWP